MAYTKQTIYLTYCDVTECVTSHEVLLLTGTHEEGVHEFGLDESLKFVVVVKFGGLVHAAHLPQGRLPNHNFIHFNEQCWTCV